MPEELADFVTIEGEGFQVYVHRDTLAEAEAPGVVRFNFGGFGWCELTFDAESADPATTRGSP